MKKTVFIIAILLCAGACFVLADVVVTINLVNADGVGKAIGKVRFWDTSIGLMIEPSLSELPPGVHGFHLHEGSSCEPAMKDDKMTAAQSAGGHFDPAATGKHEGPYAEGHLGDLPPLYVDIGGKAFVPVLAPRLKTSDLKGHTLMIHAGGDNFLDQPNPLGGGGARIACGVVK